MSIKRKREREISCSYPKGIDRAFSLEPVLGEGGKGVKEALKKGALKLAWSTGREAGTSLLQREQNLQEEPGPGKQISPGEKKSDEQSLKTRIGCLLEGPPLLSLQPFAPTVATRHSHALRKALQAEGPAQQCEEGWSFRRCGLLEVPGVGEAKKATWTR